MTCPNEYSKFESVWPGPPKTCTWNWAPMIKVTFLGSNSNGGKTWNGTALELTRLLPYKAVAVKLVCPINDPFILKVSWPKSAVFWDSIEAISLLVGETVISKWFFLIFSRLIDSPNWSQSCTWATTCVPNWTLSITFSSTLWIPITLTCAKKRDSYKKFFFNFYKFTKKIVIKNKR